MTETKRPFKHKREFKKSFEDHCIRLVIDAYQEAVRKKSIPVSWEEDDITEQLVENIVNNHKRFRWRVTVNTQNTIIDKNAPKVKGYAAKSSVVDLRFANITTIKEVEYFMEAKNLKENDSHLKRRYIDTGIDSFITGKYPNFFLAGYLLEGDLLNTVDGINKLMMKDKREKEMLKRCDCKYHDQYYESVHSETGILKHFILDFTIL